MAPFEVRFEEAAEHARTYTVSGHIPCAVVIAANAERILGARSFNARGDEDASLQDRVYALASITKAIVAVGIARLVEAGMLDYREPAASYLPEFGEREWRRKIALGDIFTHSTGLAAIGLDTITAEAVPGDERWDFLFNAEPAYEPGTRFQYATLTYQLLNAIVRRRLGKRMPEFLAEYVYAPCGMTDTAFNPTDPERAMNPVGHPAATPEQLYRFGELELSGAGLWSSAADLVKLGQAMLQPGKLLGAETWRLHTVAQPSLPAASGEGASRRTWGWNRETQATFPLQPASGFYHGGATGTLFWVDPERQLVFVFLTNRWGSGNEHTFATLNYLYQE